MRETIYTIPVNEAFAESGSNECPFCAMRRKLNENSLEFVLGPSYMEEDVREKTNAAGFCAAHMEEMYGRPNRLGLALMTHTHLMKINRDLGPLLKKPGGKKFSLTRAKRGAKNGAAEYLKKLENSCYVCERVDETFLRYVDTFFYLWDKDAEIKQTVANSGGFCLKHFRVLLETGEEKLSAAGYAEFVRTVAPLELRELKALEDDLEWFTRKFDYRNADEPWKNSKDALIRGLKKINSVKVEE